VVVMPGSVEEAASVVEAAGREGASVVAYGGGTKMGMGNRPRGVDVVLGMERLNRMVDHQPGDMTATFEAGVPLSEANRRLGEKGQWLPLQSPMPERATIGGILATAYSGPMALGYGLPRDWVIGMRVVNADGRVTKSGGKVVKNVTGYDLHKLYTGSLGTLGIILEATSKVAPRPQVSRTLVARFGFCREALEASRGLLKDYASPQALVVVNGVVGNLVGLGDGWTAVVMVEGRSVGVETRVVKAREYLGERMEEVDEGIWQRLVDMPWREKDGPTVCVRYNVTTSKVGEAMESAGAEDGVIVDVGMGVVRRLWWMEGDISKNDLNMVAGRGEWVVERCPPGLKEGIDVWGEAASVELMRRVKAKLDPKGILSPGRFVGGI